MHKRAPFSFPMDITAFTIGEVLASLRDAFVILSVATLIWKARGWYQAGIDLKNRAVQHMDFMESSMQSLLGNHLNHIQEDLRTLSGRQLDISEGGTNAVQKRGPTEVL